MSAEIDEDVQTSLLRPDKRLKRFKDWLKLSREAFEKQRKREREDLLQQSGENRWPPEAQKERQGRPMISISLIQQPLQMVYNQAAAAHFGVDLKPVSEKAQSELADVKKGLYERIQRDGMADQARMWAFDRASQCGMGWYRIITKYDEDSDDTKDQEIAYERILHQEMVYADPSAQKPDFCDARFLGLGAHWTKEKLRREYNIPATAYASTTFSELVNVEPDWVKVNGSLCEPLVVEMFYKDGAPGEKEIVRRAVCSALDIYEDEPWMGGLTYIPFVPVIGRELQPVDGERRWEGMVRPARDGQLAFDYANSTAIEDVSTSSKAKYLVVEGQITDKNREAWDRAHRVNQAYLEYSPLDIQGQPAPPPQLVQVDGTKMQLSLGLAQMARELVQSATSGFEPLEVPKQKAEQSGKAIMALQTQSDAGRSHYIQNVKDISLPLDARIILEMMPVVYDRPGRVTHILGGEDESEAVMLNQHYVMGQDGMPQQVPPGTQGAKYHNLAEGKYAIVPTMGKSPQTRLQQGQEFLTAVVNSAPEMMMGLAGDLVFKFRDEPGAKEIAERLKRHIQATNPGIVDDQDNTAEKAQAENQSLKQQLQMLTQQAQEMAKVIETEQVKHQANIQIAQIKDSTEQAKIAADIQIVQMNNAAKLAIERAKLGQAAITQQSELAEARLATGLKLQAEASESEAGREHDEKMAAQGRAHEVGMGAAGGKTMTRHTEQGQEGEQEQSRESSQGANAERGSEQSAEPQADGAGE